MPSCRCMLAEKLLSKGDYDCDQEIRTLELLKLRFGEANLLNCEVRPAPLAPAVSLSLAPYIKACILLAGGLSDLAAGKFAGSWARM